MINITLAPDDIRVKYPEIHLDVRMGNDIIMVLETGCCVPIPRWRFSYEEQGLNDVGKFQIYKTQYLRKLFLDKMFGKSKSKNIGSTHSP